MPAQPTATSEPASATAARHAPTPAEGGVGGPEVYVLGKREEIIAAATDALAGLRSRLEAQGWRVTLHTAPGRLDQAVAVIRRVLGAG